MALLLRTRIFTQYLLPCSCMQGWGICSATCGSFGCLVLAWNRPLAGLVLCCPICPGELEAPVCIMPSTLPRPFHALVRRVRSPELLEFTSYSSLGHALI